MEFQQFTTHNFDSCKEYEASRHHTEEKILSQCGFICWEKTQLTDDICGADYFAYRQNCDKKFCIDFKHRSVKRTDIALEICSVYRDKNKISRGWSTDSSKNTDVIIYTFPKCFIVLKFSKILEVIEKELQLLKIDKLQKRLVWRDKKKYFIAVAHNPKYTTYSICIPIQKLSECILYSDSF